MIAHVPGTHRTTDRTADRTTDVAVPRPRTEPAVPRRTTPEPQHAATGDADPTLVAARLEDVAALLTWVARLALLLAVGLVVFFVLL